jgi:hypothetical protein
LAIVVTCTRQGTGRVDAVFWGYLLLVDGDIKCELDYSAAGDGRISWEENHKTSDGSLLWTDGAQMHKRTDKSWAAVCVCIYVRRVRDSRKSRHTKQL